MERTSYHKVSVVIAHTLDKIYGASLGLPTVEAVYLDGITSN